MRETRYGTTSFAASIARDKGSSSRSVVFLTQMAEGDVRHYTEWTPRLINRSRETGSKAEGLTCVYESDRDTIYKLPCTKWASRARHWQTPEIVEEFIAMGAFVTPIGFKLSEYNDIEWRICFNTAETELVNNLNDTQVKTYVIMKMIVNDVLKPQTKEVTSYIVKNIVLRQAENNPQLPYYMIPERNLMEERNLEDEQQRVLVKSITDMMDEGPRMILRVKKIRQAVVCHPEPLLWYSKMRTELEMLVLKSKKMAVRCRDENVKTHMRISQIILEVLMRMRLEGSSVGDPMVVLESMLS
ncbi:hypothetical protein DPMN_046788 [Dreissena polymorpha]|uniref:Uncharacterized protein n=1 Tax=Dreissena polymorpha TaxID=45954 RepID=A0A9D4I0X3_DREPO|nr:hypothetical protein DPMN_046788 [Dreissena polymorpha]